MTRQGDGVYPKNNKPPWLFKMIIFSLVNIIMFPNFRLINGQTCFHLISEIFFLVGELFHMEMYCMVLEWHNNGCT